MVTTRYEAIDGLQVGKIGAELLVKGFSIQNTAQKAGARNEGIQHAAGWYHESYHNRRDRS